MFFNFADYFGSAASFMSDILAAVPDVLLAPYVYGFAAALVLSLVVFFSGR